MFFSYIYHMCLGKSYSRSHSKCWKLQSRQCSKGYSLHRKPLCQESGKERENSSFFICCKYRWTSWFVSRIQFHLLYRDTLPAFPMGQVILLKFQFLLHFSYILWSWLALNKKKDNKFDLNVLKCWPIQYSYVLNCKGWFIAIEVFLIKS